MLCPSYTRTFAFAFAINTDDRQTNVQAHRHTNMKACMGRQMANANSQCKRSISKATDRPVDNGSAWQSQAKEVIL